MRGWPRFTGELRVAGAEARARSDFGGVVERRPRAVLRAANAEDVRIALVHARSLGLRVVARGQGHSTAGQSLADDALVVELAALDRIGVPRDGCARVGAGATWSRVVAGTYAHGLTPPVLTDYLELSVGGTLSVGGVGGQSSAHGLQIDNVVELEVCTGAGERVRCSQHHERELFDACLGGLGQLGIIVEATLRLVPAPRRVRVRHLPFAGLAQFLAAQHVLARAGTFDYLCGNMTPPAVPMRGADGWELAIECVEHLGLGTLPRVVPELDARLDREPPPVELDYLASVFRLDAAAASWRREGTWTAWHPWLDVFLPATGALPVVTDALGGLDRDALGGGHVMTYPLLRARHRETSPVLPDDDEAFLFDILPTVPRSDPARRRAYEQRYARVLAAALDVGATTYPIGYPLGEPGLDRAQWRRLLGPRHAELVATRRRHDPDEICGALLRMT